MGITAFKSLITYGQRPPPGTGASGSENSDICPAILWGGTGIFDGRSGYNVTRLGGIGYYGSPVCAIDQVPSTISAVNIAASQQAVDGTALTLVSSTGAGITVLATALQVWPSGNTIPVGTLVIDGSPALVGFGTVLPSTGATRMSAYDPTTMLSRNIRIVTAGGSDAAAVYNIVGYDVYGYPMHETMTGPNATTGSGKKAFKFITSITPVGTIASTSTTVGTGDVIGLPILTTRYPYLSIFWNSALVTAATGFVAADATTPSATTGDVRGTYALQAASNNTLRLTVFINPAVANCNSIPGLWGLTQF